MTQVGAGPDGPVMMKALSSSESSRLWKLWKRCVLAVSMAICCFPEDSRPEEGGPIQWPVSWLRWRLGWNRAFDFLYEPFSLEAVRISLCVIPVARRCSPQAPCSQPYSMYTGPFLVEGSLELRPASTQETQKYSPC